MRSFVLVLSFGLSAFPACLDLGGVDDPPSPKPDAGVTDGSINGDTSFPDGAGGTGGTGSGGSAGQGGSSGSSSGGSGGSGGGVSWKLHTYNTANGTWSSIAVDSVWAGANAPPSSGIVAVTQLEHFDRLLVFGEDGNFYLRSDGAWQPAVPISQKFPALGSLTLRSVYHVASPPGLPLDEGLTFIANPIAVQYEYHSNDAIVFFDQTTMADDPPPAAPLNSGTCVFDFEMRDPAKHGAADYYEFFLFYSDGKLYRFDAAFNWANWPVLSSPFWNGKPTAPDPTTIRAAWYDEKYGRVQLIGP